MKMINKILKKDKKDTIYDVSKIIEYCSIKYIEYFLFFSSKFAKLENSATGPSAATMRLEI